VVHITIELDCFVFINTGYVAVSMDRAFSCICLSACLETDDSPADAVGRTVDEWSGDGGVECRCSQHADLLHVAS